MAIPRTVERDVLFGGRQHRDALTDFQVVRFGVPLRDDVPPCRGASSVASEPCFHSTRYTRAKLAGSIAVIEAFLDDARARRPTVNAIGVTLATPGTRRSAGGDRRDALLPLVWEFSTIRLPAKERLDGLVDRGLRPGREHRHERDQREPDVSAAAVTIVRPGWRIEFSRARRPVMPRHSPACRPRARGAGTTR